MTLIRFIHPFKNVPVTGVLRGKKMCAINPYPTFIVRYSEDERRPPHDLHISQRDIIEKTPCENHYRVLSASGYGPQAF